MSDETTTPDVQDQSVESPDTPEVQPASENSENESSFDEFDLSSVPEDADREWFGKRVDAFQKDYTRKTQKLAEERTQASALVEAIRDPDHPAHEQVMSELGYQPTRASEYEDDDYLQDDPDEKISALEQRLAAQEQQQQMARAQEAQVDYLAEEIESIQEREDVEFSEEEVDWIATYASVNPNPQGQPDVAKAHRALKGLYDQQQKRYLESKKAPRLPGNGVPAMRDVDLSNREARIEYAEQVAEAALAAERPS